MMADESMTSGKDVKKHVLFASFSAIVLVLDQLSKWLIMEEIALHRGFAVIPGFFNIVHVQNPGGAFGIFAGETGLIRALLFGVVALIAAGLVIYLHYRTPRQYRVLTVGFALIFSGAVGNLIDRIRFGKVIDFIDIHIGTYHWPAFNIADSAITVGMVIFAYYLIVKKVPA